MAVHTAVQGGLRGTQSPLKPGTIAASLTALPSQRNHGCYAGWMAIQIYHSGTRILQGFSLLSLLFLVLHSEGQLLKQGELLGLSLQVLSYKSCPVAMFCKITYVITFLWGRFCQVCNSWMTAIWFCHFLHTKTWFDAHVFERREDAIGWCPTDPADAMGQLPTPLYFIGGDFKGAFILSWESKAETIPLAQKNITTAVYQEINSLGESSYSNARGLHQKVWAVPIVCEHWVRTKTDWARKGPMQRHSEPVQNRTL